MNSKRPDTKFTAELDKFLSALALRFAKKGARAEVAVLTLGRPTCEILGEAPDGTDIYEITFEVPPSLYNQVADRRETIQKSLLDASWQLLRASPPVPDVGLGVFIKPEPDWRNKARRWLGESNNQGRVRSDNVATHEADGLLFRSPSEIHLYRALKARDISFAPLPVFIRGGDNCRRVEPDFVIYQDGRLVVLEVDGIQFHHETPVEAYDRLTLLDWEGAKIARIKSAECDTAEKAETVVAKSILPLLKKYTANK